MTSLPKTVYAIDDEELGRESIQEVAESSKYHCLTFHSAEEFFECLNSSYSGCVVVDVRLGGVSGIEVLQFLKNHTIPLPVIMLSRYSSTELAVDVMKMGAVTLLEKPFKSHALFEAIQRAMTVSKKMEQVHTTLHDLTARFSQLVESENQVLGLLVDGKPNKQIAQELGVSLRTVELRRHKIFEKTNTDSIAVLVKLVMQLNSNEKSTFFKMSETE
jgi:FixJ family two-component response regulator